MLKPTEDILKYKNFHLFYTNLYERLFKLINIIVDENQFNIKLVKDKVNDFLDSYSYYIIDKKILTRTDVTEDKRESDEMILERLKNFDEFTASLNPFPSEEFIKIRRELERNDFNLSKLGDKQYNDLMREYYKFFDEVIKILQVFIGVASVNGFLPNILSKNSLSTIGYANYDYFFKELEALKIKMSEITTTLKVNNLFRCRRCMYSVLVIFSAYFKRKELFSKLASELDFTFLEDEKIMKDVKKGYNYNSVYDMSPDMRKNLNENIIDPLRHNISIIKRYMAYEFGEIDMSPRIKKKYGFDPTWT